MGIFDKMSAKSDKYKDGSSIKKKIFSSDYKKDINLPLSGSSKPEHQDIMRRRRGSMDFGRSKSEPQSQGILSRLSNSNPIAKAASAALGSIKK